MHDGFLNKYSLVHRGKSYTLKPLTPRQVYDDQLQLQQSIGKQKESKKKIKRVRDQKKRIKKMRTRVGRL